MDPSQPWLGNAAYFVKMLGILRVCAEKARCHPMKLSVREVYGQRYVIFDAFTMGGSGLVPQWTRQPSLPPLHRQPINSISSQSSS